MLCVTGYQVVIWILAVAVVLNIVPRAIRNIFFAGPDDGDDSQGLVIFVESLRWLSVPWGYSECRAGLRRAGFKGKFLYWKWHGDWRAWLVLPVIADAKMLQTRSQQLADFIAEQYHRNPDRPIYLMGYSCGGYLATRALELLQGKPRVESLTLLAAAFEPRRDLNCAAKRVKGNIIVSYSPMDMIVGPGTIITGTADRRHCLSIGSVGYRGPACDKVVPLPWRMRYLLHGHLGGHFSAPASRFIARRVGPLMFERGNA